VRVAPTTIGVVAVTHNAYATRSTQFEWQTDPFIWIASGQRIRSHFLKKTPPFTALQLSFFI